jgi:hypothetical protein
MFISSWALKLNLLLWYLIKPTQVCTRYHPSSRYNFLQIDTPLSTSSKLGLVLVLFTLIPHDIARLLGHYNILSSLDLISVMQSTRSINLYMPPVRIIGLLLNVSCITSRLQQPIVCTLLGILSCLFMVSQMLIGLAVLMIKNPQVVTLYTFVIP